MPFSSDFCEIIIISNQISLFWRKIIKVLAKDIQLTGRLVYLKGNGSETTSIPLPIVSVPKYQGATEEKIYSIRCLSSDLVVNGHAASSLTARNEGVFGKYYIAFGVKIN